MSRKRHQKTAVGKFIARIQFDLDCSHSYASALFNRAIEIPDVSDLIYSHAMNIEAGDVVQSAVRMAPKGDA